MRPEWATLFSDRLACIDPWLRLGYSPESLARYFLSTTGERQGLALLSGETPVACFTVRPNWLRGPLLELLAVLPEHQNQGLGKFIILWLAEETRRQGLANLWTISSAFNLTAQSFYRRLGFDEVGAFEDLIQLGETEILLRLKIQKC